MLLKVALSINGGYFASTFDSSPTTAKLHTHDDYEEFLPWLPVFDECGREYVAAERWYQLKAEVMMIMVS